jgi:hypothetical protein
MEAALRRKGRPGCGPAAPLQAQSKTSAKLAAKLAAMIRFQAAQNWRRCDSDPGMFWRTDYDDLTVITAPKMRLAQEPTHAGTIRRYHLQCQSTRAQPESDETSRLRRPKVLPIAPPVDLDWVRGPYAPRWHGCSAAGRRTSPQAPSTQQRLRCSIARSSHICAGSRYRPAVGLPWSTALSRRISAVSSTACLHMSSQHGALHSGGAL